jgi:hypothetical protein
MFIIMVEENECFTTEYLVETKFQIIYFELIYYWMFYHKNLSSQCIFKDTDTLIKV